VHLRRSALLGTALVAAAALSACGVTAVSRGVPDRAYVLGVGSPQAASNGLARSLLREAPLPHGAARVARLPVALQSGVQMLASPLADLARLYVVKGATDLPALLEGHFAHATISSQMATMNVAPYAESVYWVSVASTNQHVALELLSYTTTPGSNGTTELRIDAGASVEPLTLIPLPTTGTVTVQLEGSAGSAEGRPSTGGVTVVLRRAQAVRLAAILTGLQVAPAGGCHEDRVLFAIRARSARRGPVVWSAEAGACPGILTEQGFGASSQLNDRGCTLERTIASYFSAAERQRAGFGVQRCEGSSTTS
jgi:hypothetical protein